jgi:hypothetical protein
MSNTSTATQLSATDVGGNNQPNLTVVPPAKPKRTIFALNKRQQTEVTRALSIVTVSRKAAYAPVLAENKITAAFITTLETDAKAAQTKSEGAWNCTKAKEGFTADEKDTKKALLKNLRCIQAAARNEYQESDPDKVGMYLVGQNITDSRVKLESSATAIINRAMVDLPGSITPAFVGDTQTKLDAYIASHGSQQSELGQGKQFRQQRNDQVLSIIARRKKVQYAADTAWPPSAPGSAKARVEFQLPKNRPFSY